MCSAMFIGVAILSAPSASRSSLDAAQQRDITPRPAGTAEIAGVLLSADAAPQPVRRAVVTVSRAGSGDRAEDARSVLTDDAGRFSIGRLPAGQFDVTARKASYLDAKYGATRPGRPGSPIALADGQRVEIRFTIFKGSVIAGMLRDAAGQPLAGVAVVAINVRDQEPSIAAMLAPPTVSDDQGAYRLYGLMPGEYIIATSFASEGAGALTSRSTADMDALLATLGGRTGATGPATTTPAGPAPVIRVGPAPIYFPGTPIYAEAGRVRLQPGEERDGVSFTVDRVPVATIEGTIAGQVPSLAAVELSVILPGPRFANLPGTLGITGKPPNERGEFSYSNVPPGQYRIVARARRGEPGAPPPSPLTGRGGGGAASSGGAPAAGPAPIYTGEQLFAVADVDVRGRDVTGVTLHLQPGGTLSGKVVFDSTTATMPAQGTIRIGLNQIGSTGTAMSGGARIGAALTSLQSVGLDADGTFRIVGIGPAAYTLGVMLPVMSSTWRIRSAIVDGRDLLDEIIEGPSVQLSDVIVTLTDKRTELSGTLQSATSQPAVEYFVVAFSPDRRYWRPGSRRAQWGRPATDGRFAFRDLPPGEYLLAALTDLDPAAWLDPAFLEQVAPSAVKVTLGEGQRLAQDLRIR